MSEILINELFNKHSDKINWAYLSRNPSKRVISPETWFGPEGPNQWSEMYCKDWIILPTYYNKGYILPK